MDQKERPILFSAPMVRALLAGTKTQTRRTVRGCPHCIRWNPIVLSGYAGWTDEHGRKMPCPYGAPGDRLWVREAWRTDPTFDARPPRDVPQDAPVQYEAGPHADVLGGKLRPSMFMPRWACRLVLTIESVRVERLHDVSRGDAMAEGCPFPNLAHGADPRAWYEELWRDLNGADSWRANPFVWVVEFRKTPNVAGNRLARQGQSG